MAVVYVLAVVLVLAFAVFIELAMGFGLFGMHGAVRFVRCDHCGHLGTTSMASPERACTHCRNGRLLHPTTLRHAEVSNPSERRGARRSR